MLPAPHRMRTSTHFAATTRSGARQGRRNVVVYVRPTATGQPARAGFVVSKKVGNAVVRNLVKRRLRDLVGRTLSVSPEGFDVVVRALPASADADFEELRRDWESAWRKAAAKAEVELEQAAA